MEVSAALDLNKTTAHRVLNSLIYMGYARQNAVNGRYESTFKVVDVANRIMGMVDIVQIVRPYLRKLMEATGETVHFVERDGIDAVYIDKVESLSNGIQMVSRIGSRIRCTASGVGKAMVAKWMNGKLRKSGITVKSSVLPLIPSQTMMILKLSWRKSGRGICPG